MSQQVIEGYQLSPQQKHLWSLSEGGDHMPYTAQCAILMEGPLDRDLLRTALRTVIERHEILRTTFEFLPDLTIPLQVVSGDTEVSLAECDFSGLPDSQQQSALIDLLRDNARQLSSSPAANHGHFSRVLLGPNKAALLVSIGSLRADTATLKLLMREIAECYRASLSGEKSNLEPLQYADLAEWQNESLQADGAEVGVDYWRTQTLTGTDLSLPHERRPETEVEFQPAAPVSFSIDAQLSEKLERLSLSNDTTYSTTLLSAFYVVLSRLCSTTSLSVGVAFDGRNYDELLDAFGPFGRFLPINAQLYSNPTLPELANDLTVSLADAERWQEFFSPQSSIPFCFEFEEANPSVQVVSDLRFTLLRALAYINRFKVLLRCLRRHDGSMIAEWHYDAAYYDEEQVKRLAESWQAALETIAAHEGKLSLAEISVLGANEWQQLRQYGRGPEERWTDRRCVHEMFADRAARNPETIAVVCESESITYGELNRRANQLAHYLRARGVGVEDRVGLMTERSIETMIALLGILKSGAAYLPLEPSQPSRRLRQLASDARVRAIVSTESWRERVRELGVEIEVYLDTIDADVDGEIDREPEAVMSPESLAYVIYTSGSTGAAKAVGVEHRQLTNYLNAIVRRLSLPVGSRFALVSTLAADLGNTVIFPALCSGGTLHIVTSETASDPIRLADYFSEHKIDCLKIVPSHLAALMTHSEPQRVLPRKCLVLGGEASSWQLIDKIRQLAPECRVLNHYGPTETTVGVMTLAIDKQVESMTAPLGYPIANTQVYVLDKDLHPAPFGVAGELHLAGANVTRGYLNSAETTAEKFIPNPFSTMPGERLYKSGDLARYLPDGSIEFLGRADDQVKVRGFRVDPAEIEALLGGHQAVKQSKVIAHTNVTGEKRLVAYVVPDDSCAATVRRALRLKREGRLNNAHELSNQMLVASQNKNETNFMYKEIFEEKIYLQHGVTLNDGDCVFDIGANIGMFSLFVGRECTNAKIYAFEPVPPLLETLRTNVALYGLNAKIFPCGVAADNHPREFTYYPHLTLMSGQFADLAQDRQVVKLFESNRHENGQDSELLDEVLKERMTTERFTCQMRRISDVIREHGLERIDLMKIDVQKSELEVLRGIDDGDWNRIEQVVLEVHDVDDRLQQITALLETRGFQVTVQQEAMLKETGLYDLYCVRPERGRKVDRSMPDLRREWTSPEALLADVRKHLEANAPEHMVPSAFVLLETMPLTANGKIDRKALPEPVELNPNPERTFVAPSNPSEQLLADIWRQVLGRSQISVDDNFFELGGDSILSIQIVARANQSGLRLSPKLIFRHQTIAQLALAIAETQASLPALQAEQGLLTGAAPLTPVQRYFFEQAPFAEEHFNQSLLLDVRRPVRADLLRKVVKALIEHHDALRLRFERTQQGWKQNYAGRETVDETTVEVTEIGEGDIESTCNEVQRSMSFESGGLFRVVLLQTEAIQRLLLVAHHLVVDGVSWRILLEDIERGLDQAERETAIDFGSKTTSYREWATRLEQYSREDEVATELAYWSNAEKSTAWELPVDHREGDNSVASTRTISVSLDAEETRALLQEVPEAYRTQINDVLLVALAEAVKKWTGRQQILVQMEGHGREELWEDVDLSRTAGWFTSLFPVLVEIDSTSDIGALLKSVKEQLRRVPNRGLGYGVLRYLSKKLNRGPTQPDLKFNYFGQLDNVLSSDSLFNLSPLARGMERNEKQRRNCLVEVSSAVSGGRLHLNLSYSDNVHRRETIERLSTNLIAALRNIIAHCRSLDSSEFSPSDFPLANLSQQQLDLIANRLTRS
jgi:amino acid adenylation domain-containing protein/non-ribosomal peptide synthase protein (TIGR01720 family)/FkbM family methyltransferase